MVLVPFELGSPEEHALTVSPTKTARLESSSDRRMVRSPATGRPACDPRNHRRRSAVRSQNARPPDPRHRDRRCAIFERPVATERTECPAAPSGLLILALCLAGCQRGCLREKAGEAMDRKHGVAASLAQVDCPDGLARCVEGVVQSSRLYAYSVPCTASPEACTCPWERVTICARGCAAEDVILPIPASAAADQLWRARRRRPRESRRPDARADGAAVSVVHGARPLDLADRSPRLRGRALSLQRRPGERLRPRRSRRRPLSLRLRRGGRHRRGRGGHRSTGRRRPVSSRRARLRTRFHGQRTSRCRIAALTRRGRRRRDAAAR